MPSPYVRRRRLAAELRRIREDRDLTADELARLVYQSRTKITRLENGQLRPDLADLMNMLDTLGVTGREYEKVIRLARDAAQKGWWDSFGDSMGPRQKLYADLESGADTIRSYNQTGFPALLQIPDLISALVDLDERQGPLEYRPERMADARTHRQRRLLQPDGPTYDAVLDESMIHRLAVPPLVKAAQLRHMVELVTEEERITFWVLPSDRPIPGGLLPKASFSLYTFPDPPDPALAVVDTVTTDLVLSKRSELARYIGMYDRLRDAALSPEDSLAFLGRVADRLADGAGSET
ncbi:helix-turn-helix transcriptional regulator [Actinomadura barringtoniae]|uniref:Helix-turn-helix transcriptional regulator n=1 Tax=Actinomadura barringtoniae TaxID=1427535 RepID=A0A939PL79_9ACTN|nr:helix-turn-helix transcriptional regulator [Actinomadura barringtoniae]MBO2451204.1 helix-turn-helix transcriptional regulator [Actinomadura barringtoniae]